MNSAQESRPERMMVGRARANGMARVPAVSVTRLPELDGVRALAVLAVMAFHYGLLPFGYLGVVVFFVLSGYLITGIVTSGVEWRTFYRRRAIRLLPALALVLLVVAPTIPAASTIAAATGTLNLTMAFGLLPVERSIGHLWSLASEWQFYLGWPPVAVWALRRWSPQTVAVAATGLAILSLGWAMVQTDWMRVWTGPDTQAWAFLVGSALALNGARVPTIRPLAWLAPIGTISYGLYLWHVPIGIWLADSALPMAALGFPLAFLAAVLSWRYVEAPLLRRDRAVRHRAVGVKRAGGAGLDPVDLERDVTGRDGRGGTDAQGRSAPLVARS